MFQACSIAMEENTYFYVKDTAQLAVTKHGCNCGPLELIPTQETTTGYFFSEGHNFCKTGIKKGLWERQI